LVVVFHGPRRARDLGGEPKPMEGTSTCVRQRARVQRTRRWNKALKSAGKAHSLCLCGRRGRPDGIGWNCWRNRPHLAHHGVCSRQRERVERQRHRATGVVRRGTPRRAPARRGSAVRSTSPRGCRRCCVPPTQQCVGSTGEVSACRHTFGGNPACVVGPCARISAVRSRRCGSGYLGEEMPREAPVTPDSAASRHAL
jgi:hypothetical protein